MRKAMTQDDRMPPSLSIVDGGAQTTSDRLARAWSAAVEDPGLVGKLVTEAFRSHHGLVFTTAHRIIDDAHEAEDVTQRVFETFGRKYRHVRDPGRMAGFLKTCAVRESLALLKRRRRRAGKQAALQLHLAPEPERDLVTVTQLRQALSQLPAEERTAVVLKFVEQHSIAEVADLMRVSLSTARRRLSSALARLAKLLGPDFGARMSSMLEAAS